MVFVCFFAFNVVADTDNDDDDDGDDEEKKHYRILSIG